MKLIQTPLETLPASIKLAGFGINRRVYLEELLLKPFPEKEWDQEQEESFNWGFQGHQVTFLAFRVLSEYMRLPSEADGFAKAFSVDIISKLPETNFNVTIELKKWVMIHTAATEGNTGEFSKEDFADPYHSVVHNIELKFEQAVDTSNIVGIVTPPKDGSN